MLYPFVQVHGRPGAAEEPARGGLRPDGPGLLLQVREPEGRGVLPNHEADDQQQVPPPRLLPEGLEALLNHRQGAYPPYQRKYLLFCSFCSFSQD